MILADNIHSGYNGREEFERNFPKMAMLGGVSCAEEATGKVLSVEEPTPITAVASERINPLWRSGKGLYDGGTDRESTHQTHDVLWR